MDWIGLIGALIGVLGLAGGVITFFVTWGKINQKIDDQAGDIADLRADLVTMKADVGRAQDAAMKVGGLATAVEHMGQRFADRIENLVEVMSLNNDHVKVQLNEIKDELRSVRGTARRARADN